MYTAFEIQQVVDAINKHYGMLMIHTIGEEAISNEDRFFLLGQGIDIAAIKPQFPEYMRMYLLGRLTAILKEQQAAQLTQEDFQQYLYRGQFVPLSPRERAEYEYSRAKTYNHLKGLANRIEGATRDILLEQNKQAIISEEISAGVKDRLSIKKVVSNIGHRTEEWSRDWDRIVRTEMQDIYNQGRLGEIIDKYGVDSLVWKQTFEGACRHCIRLHHTNGIKSSPIVFKVSELINNGTNIGRKVADWKAVVGPTHPHCFESKNTLILTSKGWVKIKDIKVGDLVLTHKGRYRRVTHLLFRTVNTDTIKKVYSIDIKVKGNKVVRLSRVTANHPIMMGDSWVSVDSLKLGDKVRFLYDRCENEECKESVPVYGTLLKDNTPSRVCCSRYCANSFTAKIQWRNPKNRELVSKASKNQAKKRYAEMSFEDRQKLTSNARESAKKLFDLGIHPIHSPTAKFKSQSANGKRRSFIELKLRYFLDQLGVDYDIHSHIKRTEIKSNGHPKFYFPDIYIKSLNMVIEADGENWHEDKEADNRRDDEIKRLIGADTYRFTEHDIRNNGDQVFEELKRLIKNHRGEYKFEDAEIVNIKEFGYGSSREVVLYNFSVEEDESYIANGIVVHNCRCDIRPVHKGQVWSEELKQFVYKDIERKVIRTSKIKIRVGDKEFEV